MCVRAQCPGLSWSFWRWNGYHGALDADPVSIRRTLLALRRSIPHPACEDAMDRVELALAEVLNNIARHGRAGRDEARGDGAEPPLRVRVDLRCWGGEVCCIVIDNGARVPKSCFQRRARRRPDAGPPGVGDRRDLPEGGFGLDLVHAVTNGVHYLRLPRRNLLILRVSSGRQPGT